MTSGLAWQEGLNGGAESYIAMARSPDWQQFILDRPMADGAGHALLLQQRQQPPAVGHPEQGHGQAARSTMRARGCSGRSASTTCCGGSTRRASRAAAPASTCSRATWRRSAISGCAAACGKESRSCRRRGSRACAGQCRHARELGARHALRPPVLGHAEPRRLHGGRLPPPAHRRDAEARHRGGGDRLVALLHPQRHGQLRRATASATLVGYLAAAVTSDGAVAADPAATAELAERVKAGRHREAGAGQPPARRRWRRPCPARPGGSPPIRLAVQVASP